MFDDNLQEIKIPAERLLEIKATLEKEHGREFTDAEVLGVAELMYMLANISVKNFLREAEWKRKLEKFPNGYAFEEKGYTCRLCHGGSDAGMWYDRFGLKCMHCQKAVESGLIHGELTDDHESFYTDYDLESYFNVKGKALTEWIRNGIIKARVIPKFNDPKIKHERLFLIADNYGFLPQKEMIRFSDTMIEEVDGKQYERHLKWYQCCDPFEYLKDYAIMGYLRRTDAENPPTRHEVKSKPHEEFCRQTTFPNYYVNNRYATKRRAKRKKQ